MQMGAKAKMWRLPQLVRGIVAGLFVVLAITYAVRSALVAAYLKPALQNAAHVWEDHPQVLAALSRVAIAEAAVQNKPLPPKAAERLKELAERAPLSPEPFLVAGAVAISEKRYPRAEQLLLAARTRAPRSTATRYLLAEFYWGQDRVEPALHELAAVRRLIPDISTPLVAGLAQYVRQHGATPQLRAILSADSQLKGLLLSALASDPENTEVIISLAGSQRDPETTAPWVQRLSTSLIEAGEYRKAHALWLQLASEVESKSDEWVFASSANSSPFGWQFTEKSTGSSVPAGERLEVFFTGRESVNFASKLVLLTPGSYEISMLVSGTPPSSESIHWSVTCLPSKEKIADIPLTKSGRASVQFRVPQACAAQHFQLKGIAQTSPETVSFSISELRVERVQTP